MKEEIKYEVGGNVGEKIGSFLGKAGEKAKQLAKKGAEKTKEYAEKGVEKAKELSEKGYAKSKEMVYEKKKELVLDYLKDVQKDDSLDKEEKETLLDARHIVSEVKGEEVNPKDLVKGRKYNYIPEPGDKIKFKSFSNNQYFFKDKKGKLLALSPSEFKKYVSETKTKEEGGSTMVRGGKVKDAMEREVKISYNWRRLDGKEIPSKHKEALEESAMERIQQMMGEGYTSGELHDNITMFEADGDGVDYQGWWEIDTKVIKSFGGSISEEGGMYNKGGEILEPIITKKTKGEYYKFLDLLEKEMSFIELFD